MLLRSLCVTVHLCSFGQRKALLHPFCGPWLCPEKPSGNLQLLVCLGSSNFSLAANAVIQFLFQPYFFSLLFFLPLSHACSGLSATVPLWLRKNVFLVISERLPFCVKQNVDHNLKSPVLLSCLTQAGERVWRGLGRIRRWKPKRVWKGSVNALLHFQTKPCWSKQR